MLVRQAVSEDYEKLMALFRDFLERDVDDSFQKVLTSETNFILVAEDAERLAGFITASVRSVVRYPKPIMQVDEVYVDPDFRQHGLGKQFMQAMESIAATENCQIIYIESAYKHEIGHMLYQRSGYSKDGYYFRKNL